MKRSEKAAKKMMEGRVYHQGGDYVVFEVGKTGGGQRVNGTQTHRGLDIIKDSLSTLFAGK